MSAVNGTSITDLLVEPFSTSLIDQKGGKPYLPHEIVRDRLIIATGNVFDWTIDQVIFRDDGVTRRPADRTTGETRRPGSMIVIGTLTIPGLGSRAGIGAHPLDEGSGEDAAYKSAESDALKRAAMAFGVGLRQLYIDKTSTRQPRSSSNQSRGTRQTGSRPPEPISDAAFASEVQRAMAQRDAETFRKLAGSAGANIERWMVMIKSSDSLTALSWIERQIERQNISHHGLIAELNSRKAELAA